MYNILVVDDDKEIVKAIEIYLGKENYKIYKAYDGEQALEQIKNNNINLVILDIMMPNKDGLETLQELRKSKNIPVIMLSAKSEDVDKINGLNIGADDYVTKPFNPVELIARVNALIRRYTQFGAIEENKGKVFSIEEIYTNVWEDECYAADNVIAVHIRHIREKIEINPKEPKYLKVIWGIGYKIENIGG